MLDLFSKKDKKTDEENYGPVSTLLTLIGPSHSNRPLCKVYDRLIYDQLYPYFDKICSKF